MFTQLENTIRPFPKNFRICGWHGAGSLSGGCPRGPAKDTAILNGRAPRRLTSQWQKWSRSLDHHHKLPCRKFHVEEILHWPVMTCALHLATQMSRSRLSRASSITPSPKQSMIFSLAVEKPFKQIKQQHQTCYTCSRQLPQNAEASS